GDDVTGFESHGDVISENLVTGNYPGRARNGAEMRMDIETAFSYSPCKPKVNLHSMYGEPGTTPRSDVTVEDFQSWVDWAKANGFGMDFNVSFFTHPMMNNGFSIAALDKKTRDYWIKAGIGGREIANEIGKQLGEVCINNIWVPDGLKDLPANRFRYRSYLEESLDEILEKKYDKTNMRDVLEGKLFAIGVETFTVGSHEFYLGYAAKNGIGVCMDTGHYHPTESIVDKISSVYNFVDTLLLHISRGIRWDSDHVLIQGDDLTAIMNEIVRGNLYSGGKMFMGLDYFDASVNRVAAWTIGLRSAGKALISALCEPFELLDRAELDGDFTFRLALIDECKNLPINDVWNYLCYKNKKPVGTEWIEQLKKYENDVQKARI
ncbi:MAG: L-rhamnose isomerase, partial [Oscillospiraceae bacterium]|nr:L-rhamnose isomerase [Oscillospiraceae bacterium]